eukprot:72121_1
MSDRKAQITSSEIIRAGFSGFFSITATIMCWYFNVVKYDIQMGNLDTEQELIDFYADWNDQQAQVSCLVFCAAQWVSIPLLVYFVETLILMQNRIFDISYVDKKMTQTFCTMLIVISALLPVPIIVGRIFEWDFKTTSGESMETGYFIQLSMVRLCIVLLDSCMIPLLCISLIHWNYVLKNRIIYFSICVIVLFGGLMQMFGWQQSGFFSVHGASQYFSLAVFISFICISIWMVLNRNLSKFQYQQAETDI